MAQWITVHGIAMNEPIILLLVGLIIDSIVFSIRTIYQVGWN